ncbi:MAG TPA: TMEM175 family protein [Ktedonobacteraceae bacterium]|nr:TMEM175 family protein [Ktedonobacteraceae bacterium]
MDTIKDEKETGRLEGFSDGVIAVAITLLVLALQPPSKTSNVDLLSYLWQQWPFFLAFVTSFATVGVMWINHHRMFSYIKRADSTLMSLNLLLLLFIVFIPFPTALVAQYLTSPKNERVAALLFNGTYFLLAICFNLLMRYATHENRLLGKDVNQREIEAMLKQFRFGPLAYLVTFALTWVSVPVSLALNLLLALFWALPVLKRPSFIPESLPFKARTKRTGTTGEVEE